ncbi:MAG: phosphotransferase [Acidobacteriota bacterium]|nr:phosphotransferase [Acidobacteriota bacterium]MDE3222254.1 phosphotransferase [Acidobacteriota bacterium]
MPLAGGNATLGVVRVGSTVRRPSLPSTPSVVALLEHYAREGVTCVPEVLGYDERGRLITRYVEGSASPDPSDLSLEDLRIIGRLVRKLHDVATTFHAPTNATWNVLLSSDGEELICHHDLAPWNLVRGEGNFTFIDWDGAGPGTRLGDLAYAAHGFVALSPRSGLSDHEAMARLVALVDGYGLKGEQRLALSAILADRVRSMYEFLRASSATNREPWARLWREGHGEMWLADALYVDQRSDLWRAALRGA